MKMQKSLKTQELRAESIERIRVMTNNNQLTGGITRCMEKLLNSFL